MQDCQFPRKFPTFSPMSSRDFASFFLVAILVKKAAISMKLQFLFLSPIHRLHNGNSSQAMGCFFIFFGTTHIAPKRGQEIQSVTTQSPPPPCPRGQPLWDARNSGHKGTGQNSLALNTLVAFCLGRFEPKPFGRSGSARQAGRQSLVLWGKNTTDWFFGVEVTPQGA